MTELKKSALAIAVPAVVAAVGFLLWRAFGFEALNALELPLMHVMNGVVGRSAALDQVIIFLNRWPGEALCVLIMLLVYASAAQRLAGPNPDWRRIAGFGGFILLAWAVANGIGDRLEPVFSRASPSAVMGDAHRDLDTMYEVRVKTGSGRSFPSNHGSVFFMVFFMMLHRWGPRKQLLLVVLPAAIILSTPRVFGGAHWMTDTLIGSAIITWLVAAVFICAPIYSRVYLPLEDFACRTMDRWMGRNVKTSKRQNVQIGQ